MKGLLSAMVLAFPFLLLGCDSGRDESPEWWGEMSALRNGEEWTAVPLASDVWRAGRPLPAAADSFSFRRDKWWFGCRVLETISFGQLPREAGVYELPRIPGNRFSAYAYYAVLDGGDAITDWYNPNEKARNWIAIDRYDPATWFIEGRFELTLVPGLRSTPGAPDTLRFEQGRFRTVILPPSRLPFGMSGDTVTRVAADGLIVSTSLRYARRYPLHHLVGDRYYPDDKAGRSTTIGYALPEATHARLTVYDVTGREVGRLVDRYQTAGEYQVEFEASNPPSGVYTYRLETADFSTSRSIVLMK